MTPKTAVATSSSSLSPTGIWWTSGSLTETFRAQNQELLDQRSKADRFEVATPKMGDAVEKRVMMACGEDDDKGTGDIAAETMPTTDGNKEETTERKTTTTTKKIGAGLIYLRRPSYADRHRKSKLVVLPKWTRHEAAI